MLSSKFPRVRFIVIALVALAVIAPVAQARPIQPPPHRTENGWTLLKGLAAVREAQQRAAASHPKPSHVTTAGSQFDLGSAAIGTGVAVALAALCALGAYSAGVRVTRRRHGSSRAFHTPDAKVSQP